MNRARARRAILLVPAGFAAALATALTVALTTPAAVAAPPVLTASGTPAIAPDGVLTATAAPPARTAAVTTALIAAALDAHQRHLLHEAHLAHMAGLADPPATTAVHQAAAYATTYGYGGLEALWDGAGGPAWAAPEAASIALCESGGNIYATNPYSGAAGLWQILGLPFPGNPYNPYTNARMAVAKFDAAGDSFAPWVC